MTRVSVAPKPASGEHWDPGKDNSRGSNCGLIGALSGFIAPGTGGIAAGVCKLVSRTGRAELKPEDPDLFVGFSLGQQTYRSPVIPNRYSHDRHFELFVPGELLRHEPLRVAVYDLDGEFPVDATLIADSEVDAAALSDGVELKEPRLDILRLRTRPAPRGKQKEQLTISAADGLVPVEGLQVPAGMLVEVRAKGSYQIGSWNDETLGPDGYPGGGPQGYNLPGEVFESAKHGAAVALLQIDSAAQAVVIGECARFIAETGGNLLLGINDHDHSNNRGDISFEIRLLAPDAQTWQEAAVQDCR